MGIIIERAAAEEARRLLRHHGLACRGLDRAVRATLSLSEADWEAVLTLLDPLAKEAMRRWLVPVVYQAVSVEMERWHASAKSPPPLLDRAGVAARLNVSERTVERLIADGLIVPLWIAGSRRFSPEGVESFLKRYAIRGRQPSRKGSNRA